MKNTKHTDWEKAMNELLNSAEMPFDEQAWADFEKNMQPWPETPTTQTPTDEPKKTGLFTNNKLLTLLLIGNFILVSILLFKNPKNQIITHTDTLYVYQTITRVDTFIKPLYIYPQDMDNRQASSFIQPNIHPSTHVIKQPDTLFVNQKTDTAIFSSEIVQQPLQQPHPGTPETVLLAIYEADSVPMYRVRKEYWPTSTLPSYVLQKINLKNIPIAYRTNAEVWLRMVVNENDSISGIEIINSPNQYIDTELRRVITEIQGWKAGTKNSQPVSILVAVRCNLELKETNPFNGF